MEEWLKSLLKDTKSPLARFLLTIPVVLFVILGLISALSDAGLSQEITQNRATVWVVAISLAVLLSLGWHTYQVYQERNTLRSNANKNQKQIEDLTQQTESLLALMPKYKQEAQRSIIKHLKQFATYALMQDVWQQRGAKVERFRVNKYPSTGQLEQDFAIQERTLIIINIGSQDNVVDGMTFIVQDPTDSATYGTIVVTQVSAKGSTCKLLEIADQAFWSGVLEACKSDSATMVEAPSNVIIPIHPENEIQPDAAHLLLDWLQKLENANL